MSDTYRGKLVKEMSREELEAAVIFLSDLNMKLTIIADENDARKSKVVTTKDG